jgi:hypothetical protein
MRALLARSIGVMAAVTLLACGGEGDATAEGGDAGVGGRAAGGGGENAGGGDNAGGGGNPGGGGGSAGGNAGGGAGGGGGAGNGGSAGGGTGGDCEPTDVYFERRVYAPLMARTCANCHVDGGAAGATRLRLPRPDAPDFIAASLEVLEPLARETVRGLPVLVAKPSGQHPGGHGGGLLVPPGSVDYLALSGLAARLSGADPCAADTPVLPPDDPACAVEPPGLRGLRRLSHVEYTRTVRDLLGTDPGPLVPDRVVHGFDNIASALNVTSILADQYRTAAERMAFEVDLGRVLPCGERTRDCALSFARTFGRKLFRRPLTGEDLAQAMSVYDLAATEGFETGVRWILVSMLQSPHFLYRTELGRRDGDRFVLTPYEIAAELSFLFWQTTPDDTLLDLAGTGALLDPEVVEREALRLLEDPRSAETMRRFTERWLGTDRLPIVTRDPQLFPHLTADVRAAMAEETARFVTGLWSTGGTLDDLLRSPSRPMTAALAQYYGLPAPASEWAAVDVSGTPYGGVLTHGSVLVTHALPTLSSPIHRGLFVRERLLCQELPDPPANLDTSPPPPDPNASTRARYTEHSSNPACSGCHTLIDPIGFSFEHFDASGKWRAQDGVHAIDTQGEILGTTATNARFDGLGELADLLAESEDVRACYITQWIRHGFGVDDALPLDCYVNRVGPRVEGLRDILPALAGTTHFRERIGGEAELDVPGADLVPTAPGAMPEAPEPVEPPSMPPTSPPDPPGGEVTPGAVLVVTEASRWETGYCANARVENQTDAELRWAVEHRLEGTLSNLWNAEGSGDTGRVVFRGVAWNATLAPGQSAEFGWCAAL